MQIIMVASSTWKFPSAVAGGGGQQEKCGTASWWRSLYQWQNDDCQHSNLTSKSSFTLWHSAVWQQKLATSLPIMSNNNNVVGMPHNNPIASSSLLCMSKVCLGQSYARTENVKWSFWQYGYNNNNSRLTSFHSFHSVWRCRWRQWGCRSRWCTLK